MKNLKLILPLALLALIIGLAGQALAQRKKMPKPVEKPLPNLSLKTIEGEEWNLYDERGKVVLLNFWATWCAPCREEIPILVKLSERYKEKDVRIVGINLDSDNTDLVKTFIKDFQISYPILLTVPGSLLTQQKAVPMSLLVDEKGVLAKKYTGSVSENIFENDIKELLAKKSSPKNALPKTKRPKAANNNP